MENQKELAQGFLKILTEQGKPIPPGDPVTDGVYPSLQFDKTPLLV